MKRTLLALTMLCALSVTVLAGPPDTTGGTSTSTTSVIVVSIGGVTIVIPVPF